MKWLQRPAALCLALAALCVAAPCHAVNLWKESWGIASDPFKLGKASGDALESVKHIQQIMGQLSSFEIQTNTDLSNRIAQAKVVVDEIVSATDRTTKSFTDLVVQLKGIETDIFDRANKLIENVRCAVTNSMDDITNELKIAAQTIRQANPKIKLFGFTILEGTANELAIPSPIDGYKGVVAYHWAQVQSLDATAPANLFVAHYAEIIRLGRRAKCAYQDPIISQYLQTNYIDPATEMERVWVTVVNPL